jgi:radical SAM protein with 4Fe4S-binding SPASM domain
VRRGEERYSLIIVGLYDYRTNEELEKEKRYWRDRLAGATLKFSAIGLSAGRDVYSVGVPRALVPTGGAMAVPDLTFPNAPCHRPLIRMIIQHDGEVCNCCEDTSGAFAPGNVYERALAELWYSEQPVERVNDLIAGHRKKYSLCMNCPLPRTGRLAEGRKINMIPRRGNVTAPAGLAG